MLFAIQRFGTGAVGSLFGPVMAVWFLVLGVAGVAQIVDHPGNLRALSPSFAVQFFIEHGGTAFIALGSVVLAVTGAEALYADMGHFGRGPIHRAWFFMVFPALTLMYLGQGALILDDPAAIESPFFFVFPEWARIPMVLLATVATVIASQAVISGAFSVTRQAVGLGFLAAADGFVIPRDSEIGQIYVPAINWGSSSLSSRWSWASARRRVWPRPKDTTPLAMRANVEHNNTLHESVVIISIETLKVPNVPESEQIEIDDLGYRDDGISHVTARLGFQDDIDVPHLLRLAVVRGLERECDVDGASYFLSRMTIVPSTAPGMSGWRKKLFLTVARNAADPVTYFGLPDDATVVMGSRVTL